MLANPKQQFLRSFGGFHFHFMHISGHVLWLRSPQNHMVKLNAVEAPKF